MAYYLFIIFTFQFVDCCLLVQNASPPTAIQSGLPKLISERMHFNEHPSSQAKLRDAQVPQLLAVAWQQEDQAILSQSLG